MREEGEAARARREPSGRAARGHGQETEVARVLGKSRLSVPNPTISRWWKSSRAGTRSSLARDRTDHSSRNQRTINRKCRRFFAKKYNDVAHLLSKT